MRDPYNRTVEPEKSIVKIKSHIGNGLGILTPEGIITCGHLLTRLPNLSVYNEPPDFEVTRVCDGEKARFFMYSGTSHDLLFLRPQSILYEIIDGEDSAGFFMMEALDLPNCNPFPEPFRDLNSSHEGFFFEPDGKTRHLCEFTLSLNHCICIKNTPVENGSSGGPLFTAENKLVGIMVASENKGTMAYAKPIQLCMDMYTWKVFFE
jgi:hypothetical protein